MTVSQKYKLKYALSLLLIFLTLGICLGLFVRTQYLFSVLIFLFAVMQSFLLYKKMILPLTELDDFAQAVRYRDFSRHFNVRSAPAELQALREDFNLINHSFKALAREKEAQYQYLQRILELIHTGILLYETESLKVIWANESLKKITQLPYIPTLHLIERKNVALYNAIINLEPGASSIFLLDTAQLKIMLSSTVFQTEGTRYKLIALQNINEVLDENESQSWKKLLSVMTHEIMNSVAPIASLAQTLKQQLQSAKGYQISLKDDVQLGIDTIQRRSEGLLQFAASYRTLNKITSSNRQEILIGDMFENIIQLLAPRLEQRRIVTETVLKEPLLKLSADKHLVEQVVLNLVLNAIDALKETGSPRIVLSAYASNDNRVMITVADNGPGIDPEVLEKIFIPFFSTKSNGSGIGLSLCKQIMLLHKGNIFVKSQPGAGTVFYLQF